LKEQIMAALTGNDLPSTLTGTPDTDCLHGLSSNDTPFGLDLGDLPFGADDAAYCGSSQDDFRLDGQEPGPDGTLIGDFDGTNLNAANGADKLVFATGLEVGSFAHIGGRPIAAPVADFTSTVRINPNACAESHAPPLLSDALVTAPAVPGAAAIGEDYLHDVACDAAVSRLPPVASVVSGRPYRQTTSTLQRATTSSI